jgi:hypothetical protein
VKPLGQPKHAQGLRVHLFPTRQAKPTRARGGRVLSVPSQDDPELGVKEALAILEDRPYTPVPLTFWQRFDSVNQFLKTDQSLYALKTAAISSVYLALCE